MDWTRFRKGCVYDSRRIRDGATNVGQVKKRRMASDISRGTFSIVTPNYNMARYLPETIESVLANLEPGDEYFIIDGGSTDGSVDVIKQYAPRLTGWVSEKDKGYAEALVKGFQRCTGEFLCWINSGDLHLRGTLQAARRSLTETGADLIWGDDVHVDESNKIIVHGRARVHSLKNMMLYGGWTPLQDACYWRRDLYERMGGLDPNLRFAADYDFFLRASCYGKCVYVPQIFSAFRRHENQKSISGSAAYEMERQQCRKRMLQRLGIPAFQRFWFEPWYWVIVHWRHYVGSRFHTSNVQQGTWIGQVQPANLQR